MQLLPVLLHILLLNSPVKPLHMRVALRTSWIVEELHYVIMRRIVPEIFFKSPTIICRHHKGDYRTQARRIPPFRAATICNTCAGVTFPLR